MIRDAESKYCLEHVPDQILNVSFWIQEMKGNYVWHGRRNAGQWSAHRMSQWPTIPCQRHRGKGCGFYNVPGHVLNTRRRGEKITAAQSNTLPSSLTKAIGNNWAVHMGRLIFFMKTNNLNKSQNQPNVEPLGCQLMDIPRLWRALGWCHALERRSNANRHTWALCGANWNPSPLSSQSNSSLVFF